MIHCWKSAKQKLVYDTVSGAIVSLTSLEYKMIQAITPPLAPICPSSLRYELAKYDSADVEEAYEHIYSLYLNGILFSVDHGTLKKLRIGDCYGLTEANDIARDVVSILGGAMPEIEECGTISKNQKDQILALF